MYLDMELYELVLDEEKEEAGVFAISLVNEPAMESDFIHFSKQTKIKFQEVDKEQRIVMGAILIPDHKVYREDQNGGYYVYLTEPTIKNVSQKFMKQGNQNEATLGHQVAFGGGTLVESWLVDDPNNDKSNANGIPVKKGTWMGSMKIDNDEVWTEFVKTGEVRGFSIEGLFRPERRDNGISFWKEVLQSFKKGNNVS